jgi:hypothetical protein
MKALFLTIISIYICACGVKGPPRPPLKPVELGRGQPSFSGATKNMAYDSIPPLESNNEEDEKDKKKEKKNNE